MLRTFIKAKRQFAMMDNICELLIITGNNVSLILDNSRVSFFNN